MRLIVSLLAFALTAFAQVPVEHVNTSNSEALSGYDPVSYFEGTPQKGNADLTLEQAGVVYRFASEKNRAVFQANPQRYEPAYGGWCAYAMLDGDKVGIDPETYKLIDGRLYLFYNGFWGDTLKRWNKKLAKIPEQALVGQADGEWRKILD
jgi:YHS domain-containing protein